MKADFKRKLLSFVVCIAVLVSCLPLNVFAGNASTADDIAILYTNDVHTYIGGSLSYDVLAAIKADLQTKYAHVILADAGDHVQGTAYGSIDKGASIIEMMNAAGYDVATLGNHEFDYGMQGCLNVIDWADYDYISSNFYHEENGVRGENVLDSYKIFDCAGEKIAFVGITTPETFSKTTPAYFQDGAGNYIYGISGGNDGSALYADVQRAINEAKAAGATKVIALGHLGVDPASKPWTSRETIGAVSGLDAFIDGHSHTVIESENVTDKDGNNVVLTQTGEYFNHIGLMTIDSATGVITTELIEYSDAISDMSDSTVKAIKDNWLQEIDNALGQKIGSAVVTLNNYDENGNRLVRKQSTNTGDFAADALYYLFDDMDLDVDVAIMNGGGIRNFAVTGDLTYKICKDIHTFGNVACLQTVTGQQLLDMLEWGSRFVGQGEDGSFLHVSGITFKIDASIPDTTQSDEKGIWIGGPSEYRVQEVEVYNKDTNSWEDLDLDAKYNLAGYNYTLRDLGGGFAMLDGAVNVLDYVMEDYMVLANYIKGFEEGIVDATNSPLLLKYPQLLLDYSDVNGSGRIEIEEPSVWVGGVKITQENAEDVFGDGTVSYDFATKTLTLNNYNYSGEGYLYDEYNDFSAAIYSNSSLNINLKGTNVFENTFNDEDNNRYGDGVIAEGNLTLTGDGSIIITGAYGLYAENDITIDGCVADLTTTDTAVFANSGSIVIENAAALYITSEYDGICSELDITIRDAKLDIKAGEEGIYSYNGSVIFDSKSVKVYKMSPTLIGTNVSIKAEGELAVFAYKGIVVNEKLEISSPENAEVKEIYEEEYDDSCYAVLAGEEVAKELEIKPIAYYVFIEGLNNKMKVIVPAGQSLNEAYCENLGIEDFSAVLRTEKEGFVFGGWYTDEACTAGKEFGFDDKITEDVTIYAKWTVQEQTPDEPETPVEPELPENPEQQDKPTDNPNTGASCDVVVLFAALLISCAGLFSVNVHNKKRKSEN